MFEFLATNGCAAMKTFPEAVKFCPFRKHRRAENVFCI